MYGKFFDFEFFTIFFPILVPTLSLRVPNKCFFFLVPHVWEIFDLNFFFDLEFVGVGGGGGWGALERIVSKPICLAT